MDANGIIATLESGDPAVRERAARALGDMAGPEPVRALIRLLDDNHLAVRVAAARALGKSKDRAALQPLIAAQGSSDDPFRQAVSETLRQYGAIYDIVPDLLARAKSPNPYSRKAAVWVLGELRDLRAFDAVTAALEDEKDFVRSAAGFAVGKLKAKQQATVKPVKPSVEPPFEIRLGPSLKFDLAKFFGRWKDPAPVEPPVRLTLKEHLDRLAKLDFEGDKKHKFTPPKKDNGMLAR